MDLSLLNLLLTFERDCQQTVQNSATLSGEQQVTSLLREFEYYQPNNQEHNNYCKAIQHKHVPQSIDETITLDNQKHIFQNSKRVDEFIKCKHKIQEAHRSQDIRKTSKKYSRKHILSNEKRLEPDKLEQNTKGYKPNSRMAHLFTKIKQHNDFFQYQSLSSTQEENQNLFKNLTSLTLKSITVKQKTQFILYPEENQKIHNIHKVNPNLMAPKKQKLKKVKSNQHFQ